MTNPNIWAPGTSISAAESVQSQSFIATEGQTLFNITNFTYALGTNSLYVFVSGLIQRITVDFTETSVSSFTLNTGVPAGTIIYVIAFTEISVQIPVVDIGYVHTATEKTTLVNTDEFAISDSEAGWGLKKATWASIKDTLQNVTWNNATNAVNATNATDATNATNATNVTGTTQSTEITWSAKQIFGNTVKLDEVLERVTITTSAPVTNFDCLTQAIQYFTSDATANWTQNFRGDSGTALNNVMAAGESITVTVMATQGATPYYPNVIQVDDSNVTPKWLGTAPTAGDASSINVYTFTIIKTEDATFTIFASKSKYA